MEQAEESFDNRASHPDRLVHKSAQSEEPVRNLLLLQDQLLRLFQSK